MGFIETASGPAVGEASELAKLIYKARDGALDGGEHMKFAEYLNFGIRNTPFINLFYTKVALDYLFLNSMRELASPGYLRRKDERGMKDYGQHYMGREYHLKPFGK